MTSGTQTIDGIKTFSKSTILNSTLSVGGTSTLTGNVGIGTDNPVLNYLCMMGINYANYSKSRVLMHLFYNLVTTVIQAAGTVLLDPALAIYLLVHQQRFNLADPVVI